MQVSIESPRGLSANLRLAFSDRSTAAGKANSGGEAGSEEDWFSLRGDAERFRLPFRRLVCGLSLFHGACLERARYGAAGWNEPRDFDASDLSIRLDRSCLKIVSSSVELLFILAWATSAP